MEEDAADTGDMVVMGAMEAMGGMEAMGAIKAMGAMEVAIGAGMKGAMTVDMEGTSAGGPRFFRTPPV